MFIVYLKTALRNILRNKVFSFINIAGLAIGMSACIIIFLFIKYEYSFDNFNKNADRIYRINVEANINNKDLKVAVTPALLGSYLKDKLPEVKNSSTIYALDFVPSIKSPVLKYNDKIFRASRFGFVDSSFFKVFSFKMIQGNPESALKKPFSVVLTKSASQKFFGKENPIGESIRYNNKFTFTVTGVVQDFPPNSTIQFEYLGSLSSLPDIWGNPGIFIRKNDNFNYYNYILFNKGADVKAIEKNLKETIFGFWDRPVPQWPLACRFHLESLRELYWDNNLEYDMPVKGNRNSVTTFGVIAVLILLIACANFINISSAQSLMRAKEVAIRKVVGGQRSQLVVQFLMESGLMSFIALVAALILSEFFIPQVNKLLGTSLQINYLNNNLVFMVVVGIWILTGLVSGIFPAFYLSSFRPALSLRGKSGGIKNKHLGRQYFILFQFSAVIALIFCTIVSARQYYLLRFHNVGFDKENILVLKYNQGANGSYLPFKQKLLENPNILGVAASDIMPGKAFSKGGRYFMGKSGAESMMLSFGAIDPDYIKVFGMKLLTGRSFSWNEWKNNQNLFILNEAAAKKIGWTPKEAIGKPFGYSSDNLNGNIIGVLSDFNFQSLRMNAEPLVLELQKDVQSLAVKITAGSPEGTIGFIRETWKKMFPNIPIEYTFVDISLDSLYNSEEKLGTLFTLFSVLAIVIACMGLYGLSLYTAERRTKEAGIRKVLGASVTGIIILLSKEFVKWVLIANLIAWPAAYYFMNKWLQDFANKIELSWWMFILSGSIALLIALATVSSQAVKAATANPVESLRYE